MDKVILIASALLFGFLTSVFSGWLIEKYLRGKLKQRERLCVESLTSIDKLLRQSRFGELDKMSKARLVSNLMDYMMTAHSERAALNYLTMIREKFKGDKDIPIEQSREVLRERFELQDKESDLHDCSQT